MFHFSLEAVMIKRVKESNNRVRELLLIRPNRRKNIKEYTSISSYEHRQ